MVFRSFHVRAGILKAPLVLVIIIGMVLLLSSNVSALNMEINEVELNPPGDDNLPGAEWVELYNPTDAIADVSGFRVVTGNTKKVIILPPGATIPAKGFLKVTNSEQWLEDENEHVAIMDPSQAVKIHESAVISDTYDDDRTWQQYPDGEFNWVFDTGTSETVNIPEFPIPSLVMIVALLGTFLLLRKRSDFNQQLTSHQ